MRLTSLAVPVLLTTLGLLGCGGAPPVAASALPSVHARSRADAATTEPAPQAASRGAMAVSGLHGTLAPDVVRATLRPRLAELTGCFALRSMSFEHLGGQLRMSLRVAGSGDVLAAHPESSTVGDREVERCVERVLSGVRFPPTQGGGEAHVRWALSVEPPSAVRQALTWDAGRVAHLVRRRGSRALEQCNTSSSVQVTAYVSRSGRVLNVGAASSEGHPAEVLDCVAQRVRAWRMPTARHVAKVTFELTT